MDLVEEMDAVLERYGSLLPILSPAYLASSPFGRAEWRHAFAEDPGGGARRLIPVRVQECSPGGLLKTRVYIDLVDHDEAAARAELLRGVREAGPPADEPAYPGRRPAAPAGAGPRFPGALPGLFEVPFAPNPLFAGRGDVLDEVARLLGAPGPRHVLALTGSAGVGKTQLAVEHAYACSASYDVVWWARADDPVTLAGDLARLAADRRLPDPPRGGTADVEELAAAAWAWLAGHDRWLLILDNVEDPASLRPALPAHLPGHVLITARADVGWSRLAVPLPLGVLDPAAAAGFLRARSGDDDDEGAAARLAAQPGPPPLALEQAAGYIAETGGLTLDSYLRLFHQRSDELLDRGQPADREHTVATTLSLALDRLHTLDPAAA